MVVPASPGPDTQASLPNPQVKKWAVGLGVLALLLMFGFAAAKSKPTQSKQSTSLKFTPIPLQTTATNAPTTAVAYQPALVSQPVVSATQVSSDKPTVGKKKAAEGTRTESSPRVVTSSSGTSLYYDPSYRPPVGEHYVQGYTRKDGTYVSGHYQTNADNSFWNNYSSKSNLNPHTGKIGTKVPPLTGRRR